MTEDLNDRTRYMEDKMEDGDKRLRRTNN